MKRKPMVASPQGNDPVDRLIVVHRVGALREAKRLVHTIADAHHTPVTGVTAKQCEAGRVGLIVMATTNMNSRKSLERTDIAGMVLLTLAGVEHAQQTASSLNVEVQGLSNARWDHRR